MALSIGVISFFGSATFFLRSVTRDGVATCEGEAGLSDGAAWLMYMATMVSIADQGFGAAEFGFSLAGEEVASIPLLGEL
jgi:hypothetical protein